MVKTLTNQLGIRINARFEFNKSDIWVGIFLGDNSDWHKGTAWICFAPMVPLRVDWQIRIGNVEGRSI